MGETIMKNIGTVLLAALAFGSLSLSASADTLTLKSTGNQTVNGNIAVYPYNFSINGSSTLTQLMCLDYNREITTNETWNVTKSGIPQDNSQTSVDYRALALILSAIQNNPLGISNADYQIAAWSIFDPQQVMSTGGYTATAALVRAAALRDASSTAHTPGFNYSNFSLYLPTGDTTGWTNGIPQRFLGATGDNPGMTPNLNMVPTPEPSALLLLGTGVLGVASLVRSRFVAI